MRCEYTMTQRSGRLPPTPPIRGVAIDHRIHVAAGHAEEQARCAQRLEVPGALPVRLRDDPDLESLRLQYAPDDCHTEAGMIDIGITADDDDVALLPAKRRHFRARGR